MASVTIQPVIWGFLPPKLAFEVFEVTFFEINN